MKRFLIISALAMAATACSTASRVGWKEAEGYFFKNNQDMPSNVLVIESREELETHFGYATTMSRRPTEVDFASQAVIAIVLAPTDSATQVSVKDITTQGNHTTVSYAVQRGDKQSYTIQPMTMVVIDKADLTASIAAVEE